MRLAIFAISAVVATGCSGLGGGGGFGSSNGANCLPGSAGYGYQQAGYQQAAYGYQGGAAGAANCVGGMAYGTGAGYGAGYGTGYGAGAGGYGAGGYGAGGYGAGYGYGAGGAGYGATGAGFGPGGVGAGLAANGVGAGGFNGAGFGGGSGAGFYGANGFQATTLGGGAPFGAATAGGAAFGTNVVGTQFSNGGFVNGQGVQTVVGSPVYVPQPYAAPYAVPQLRPVPFGGGFGGAMPFGIEGAIGTEFDVGGDIFTPKPAGPSNTNAAVNTGGTEGISYDEAFGDFKSIGGNLAYDVSRNTTLIGGVSYGTAEGQTVEGYQSVDARSPGTLEDIDAVFSDLDLFTIEGGVRQYVGQNPAFRPYVGATAGFTHNNDVTINRPYSSDGVEFGALDYVDSGWNPTASAVVGAEMAVGPRAAIGVESGLRWRDNMDTLFESEDRVSIPLKLRGRVAF